MIVTSFAIAGLLAVAESSDSNAELFEALDTNQDGVIVSSEIAASQRIWFMRAIRVADANGDQRLTAQELDRALADPERRSPPAGRFRDQHRRIDPKRLDRNGDGMITLDEIPGPGKEQFQRLLDRAGQDAIPADAMARQMERDTDSQSLTRNSDKPMDAEMKASGIKGRQRKNRRTQREARAGVSPGTGTNRNRLMQGFNRLDANSDGKVSRRETRGAPRFIERFDRNNDGFVERSEFSGASRFRASGKARKMANRRKGNDGSAQRKLFDQFDRNKDGRLTPDEAPKRVKSRFARIDVNGDGQLTRQELEAAMKRREQKSKA